MYYAHVQTDADGNRRVQTLTEHLTQSAHLIVQSGKQIGLGKTAELIALLHDMGKANQMFQDYLLESDRIKQQSMRGKINHSSAGAQFIWEWGTRENVTALEQFCAQLVSLAILSHHGGMPDCISPNGTDVFAQRVYLEKDIGYQETLERFFSTVMDREQIALLLEQAVQEVTCLFKKITTGCQSLFSEREVPQKFYVGLTARYLLSCLIDADRYQTFCFSTAEKMQEETLPEGLWEQLSKRLEEQLGTFPTDTPIAKLRKNISDHCLESAGRSKGIYQICLPTGSGKTLSSFRFCLNHARIHKMSRIFYILPFQTIIEQNAKVIRNALGGYEGILEHHAGLIDDEDDDLSARKLLTERWNAPIILTTMVQFLNTLFAGKTQNVRRMHSLVNAVIVFDEVQAIPPKCIHLFNLAVSYLTQICGATVVLCTATQPQLSGVPIPLGLSQRANLVEDYENLFRAFRRTKLIDQRKFGSFDTGQLAHFVTGLGEKSILVVLNTKTAATKLYAQLATQYRDHKDVTVFYLSTNLCPALRLTIFSDIRAALIKSQGARVIVISTQLIEAGVDISLDCVVRSLAGLDNIAQSAGRCNRNGESTTPKPVYIVENADEVLDKLPEIRDAQNACKRVLDEFAQRPQDFEDDLLSPSAIKRFYGLYYHTQKDYMDYLIIAKNAQERILYHCPMTILELLSRNKDGRNAKKASVPSRALEQAFSSAANKFEVISNATTGVVVPCDQDAKQLIELLRAAENLKEVHRLLPKLQRYTVNLYAYTLQKLQDLHAIEATPYGVLILNERYHHPILGVVTEPVEMKLLNL